MEKKKVPEEGPDQTKPMCFVIMPLSDPDGYVKGHFKHVYEDILRPSCDRAGFKPIRADQVKQSNLIHLDILQKLLETPMALCDLSTRNPNVFFELALRQAFDKPVALVQETGTPSVFDISPLRYAEYRKERTYHEVLEDQASIAAAIEETFASHNTGKGVNSIVKLLALSKPASLPDITAHEAKADIQQLILAELSQLREEFRKSQPVFADRHRLTRRELFGARPVYGEIMSRLRETENSINLAASADDMHNIQMKMEKLNVLIAEHLEGDLLSQEQKVKLVEHFHNLLSKTDLDRSVLKKKGSE